MSVLTKARDLIDCLSQAGDPVTLGYVRSTLELPKSSTHRLLNDLVGIGVVRRTSEGLYSLGPRLIYWGEAAAASYDLGSQAKRPMEELRDNVGESVHLYIREFDKRICIAAAEGQHILRPFVEIGRPLPLHVGAAGKLLLAFADPQIRETMVAALSNEEAPTASSSDVPLRLQLEEIRRTNWSSSIGEREEGVSSVASSVFDGAGAVTAALCVSAPSTRLDFARLEELRAPLEGCAAAIHSHMSGGGGS